VGGASRRFGSPNALARFEGESLAERAHRVLAEAFEDVVVVGKSADGLELPFPVLDDGSDVRAPIVGVAAALRLAGAELCVVLPTDMPFVTAALLRLLAEAAGALTSRCRRRARSQAPIGARRCRSSNGGSRPATSRSTERWETSSCASCAATNGSSAT